MRLVLDGRHAIRRTLCGCNTGEEVGELEALLSFIVRFFKNDQIMSWKQPSEMRKAYVASTLTYSATMQQSKSMFTK